MTPRVAQEDDDLRGFDHAREELEVAVLSPESAGASCVIGSSSVD
jgi:hypothetical protein